MQISKIQQTHPNLTPAAIVLFLWLEEKASEKGKNFLYPIKNMSSDTGISDRKIRDLIPFLEEEGLICVDRSGRSYRYSLPISPDPTPPPKPKKRHKTPAKSASKKSPNIIYINNTPSSISDISDIKTQHLGSDPFAEANLAELEAEAAQVRLVWHALATWRGRKPLWIRHYASAFKTEIYPAEIRARMRELTPEQITYVCRSYAAQKAEIRHVTTWLQSALFFAPERCAQSQAHAVGETHSPDAPTPPHTPPKRPKFNDFEQRTYDYAELETQLLDAQRRAANRDMTTLLAERSTAPAQGIARAIRTPLRC